jgi:hypothetical protein
MSELWIATGDRLPPLDVDVLLWVQGRPAVGRLLRREEYDDAGVLDPSAPVYWCREGYGELAKNPSHWMPLPEGPK